MNKFSLKAKLLLGFGGVSLVLAIVALASVFSQVETTKKYEHVTHVNLSNMVLLGQMLEAQQEIRIVANRTGLPSNQNPENKHKLVKRFEKAKLQYAEADKKYNSVPFVEGEQEYYDRQNIAFKEMMVFADKVIELSDSEEKKDFDDMCRISSH